MGAAPWTHTRSVVFAQGLLVVPTFLVVVVCRWIEIAESDLLAQPFDGERLRQHERRTTREHACEASLSEKGQQPTQFVSVLSSLSQNGQSTTFLGSIPKFMEASGTNYAPLPVSVVSPHSLMHPAHPAHPVAISALALPR